MKGSKYLLPFLLCVLVSCQSFNSIVQEPKVLLRSVDIAGIGINGVDLLARVDVENTNGFPIPMPKIDWELFVNKNSFVQGLVNSSGTIKRREKVTLDLPVNVSYEGLFKTILTLADAANQKEASYDIVMGLSFPIPVIENKIFRLDFSGVLPLLQLPKLSSGSLRLSRLDFNDLVLTCEAMVENPNVFPIPFPDLSLDYGVNGMPLLKRNETKAGEIAANAAAVTGFDINIEYADLIRAMGSGKEAMGLLSLAAGFPFPAGEKSLLDISGVVPVVHKPEVSFQGITRKSLGRTMEFVFNFEVDNRNDFAFDIENFIYDFRVNNNDWAQGTLLKVPTVRAGTKTIIPVDVSISTVSIVSEVVDILNRGLPVNYDCTGSMAFSSVAAGFDIPNFPLNLQGTSRIR